MLIYQSLGMYIAAESSLPIVLVLQKRLEQAAKFASRDDHAHFDADGNRVLHNAGAAGPQQLHKLIYMPAIDRSLLLIAGSPQLHGLTGEPPRRLNTRCGCDRSMNRRHVYTPQLTSPLLFSCIRLKALTVQQVTIMQNSKLLHSAVAVVHGHIDEHRRTDREEATWRVEDTVRVNPTRQ